MATIKYKDIKTIVMSARFLQLFFAQQQKNNSPSSRPEELFVLFFVRWCYSVGISLFTFFEPTRA